LQQLVQRLKFTLKVSSMGKQIKLSFFAIFVLFCGYPAAF